MMTPEITIQDIVALRSKVDTTIAELQLLYSSRAAGLIAKYPSGPDRDTRLTILRQTEYYETDLWWDMYNRAIGEASDEVFYGALKAMSEPGMLLND